jgi:hypothetical protein
MKKDVLVLRGIGSKYTVHLNMDTKDELEKVIEALRPLGYALRFPKGR